MMMMMVKEEQRRIKYKRGQAGQAGRLRGTLFYFIFLI